MVRSKSIELKGFGRPRVKWSQVGVRFIGMASANRDVVRAELAQQGNRTKRVLIVSAAMIAASLLMGMLILAAIHGSTPPAPSTTALLWSVQQITPNGVFIRSSAGNLLIPVGGRLPNGEVLLSVGNDRQSYTTNAGRIQLTNRQPL